MKLPPDRLGARDGELLGEDDAGETGQPVPGAAERNFAGNARDLLQPLVAADEKVEAFGDVGFAFDDAHRNRLSRSSRRC